MFQQLRVLAVRSAVALAVLTYLGAGPVLAQVQHDGLAPAASSHDPFVDPLDEAAVMRRDVNARPLMTIAQAGPRLVAVGMRGLIVFSDDEGKTWQQASSPVRSDLLALSFPSAQDGWAVGHDGVILHTSDGGRSWTRQFDGRIAATALTGYYNQRIAAGEASLKLYLDQVALDYKTGPSLPLLSVCFTDTRHGIAVGPFGTAVATSDGGQTWIPVQERIDNPQFLHLDAVRQIDTRLYIVGEQGRVYRQDAATGRFQSIDTGYAGSFFGIAGHDGLLFAYGLKGTIYRSADQGSTWQKLPSPLHGAVTDATFVAARHAFAFVTAAGEATLYDPAAGTFTPLSPGRPGVFTGIHALAGGMFVLSGLGGISRALLQ
jgi:photosystem II stability/assembly factor-like uncharacterized protein